MGIARTMDKFTRQALEEGSVTAPQSIRQQAGTCAKCHAGISTHGYELVLETASQEKPAFEDKRYDSIILCERCYHHKSEVKFWGATIQELGGFLLVLGVILAVVGFAFLGNERVGLVGVALMIIPYLIRVLSRIALKELDDNFLVKHFPRLTGLKHVAIPFPWFDKSVSLCVPTALAVMTNKESAIPNNISRSDLLQILLDPPAYRVDDVRPSSTLYLPIGPWREWSFLQRSLLGNQKPGSHVVLRHPVEVLDKLRTDKNGIGFISLVYVDLFGQDLRLLEIDGQRCMPDNPDYPFWLLPGNLPVAEIREPCTAC